MRLLREKNPDGIMAKREWWSLGEGYEALVVYEDGNCSINVTGKEGDVSLSIGDKINKANSSNYVTTATIDSGFIEVPEGDLKNILSLIEQYC